MSEDLDFFFLEALFFCSVEKGRLVSGGALLLGLERWKDGAVLRGGGLDKGDLPWSSATFILNWLRSSRTRLRPLAMKSSNRSVKRAMRSRSSSKPKLMLGRVSAIEGTLAEESGARIVLEEMVGSNIAVMIDGWIIMRDL